MVGPEEEELFPEEEEYDDREGAEEWEPEEGEGSYDRAEDYREASDYYAHEEYEPEPIVPPPKKTRYGADVVDGVCGIAVEVSNGRIRRSWRKHLYRKSGVCRRCGDRRAEIDMPF
jgi:hypothetical protein